MATAEAAPAALAQPSDDRAALPAAARRTQSGAGSSQQDQEAEGHASRKRPLQAPPRAAAPQAAARASIPVVVDLTNTPDTPSDDEVVIVHEVKRPRTGARFTYRPPARPPHPPVRLTLPDDDDENVLVLPRHRQPQQQAPAQQAPARRPAGSHRNQDRLDDTFEALLAAVNPFSPLHVRRQQEALREQRVQQAEQAALPPPAQPPSQQQQPGPSAQQQVPVLPQQHPQLPAPRWPAGIPLPPPSPEQGFKCPICFEHVEDTSTTTCGHVFCTPCITESIKTAKKCPKCRKALTMRQIHKIYLNN